MLHDEHAHLVLGQQDVAGLDVAVHHLHAQCGAGYVTVSTQACGTLGATSSMAPWLQNTERRPAWTFPALNAVHCV